MLLRHRCCVDSVEEHKVFVVTFWIEAVAGLPFDLHYCDFQAETLDTRQLAAKALNLLANHIVTE